MISLLDDSELPNPDEAGTPVPAEDIAFWKDIFSVLLPPEEEPPASAQKN